jgi:rubredoxin
VWFLFHHSAKTRVVEGGKSFIETCPECRRRARFDEVEVSDNYGVFFVDLVSDKERKYRCRACACIFDLRDQPEPALPPAKSAAELERERAIEQARQLAERQRRRELEEAKANQIEDELAELKKRLGR